MATREEIRMRDLKTENDARKKVSTEQTNKQLVAQIYALMQHYVKAQTDSMREEKRQKEEALTHSNKAIIDAVQRQRVAVGLGRKKTTRKRTIKK